LILPTAAAKDVFDFETFSFNRWRAIWMNCGGTLDRRKLLFEEKAKSAAAKKS